MYTVPFAKMLKIFHLAPRNQVWTGAGWVIAREAIFTSISPYFAANKTIRMLLGIEIIQSFLKRISSRTIPGKKGDKIGVPHKNVAIVGRIDVGSDEPGFFGRIFNVPECDFPGFPVHVDGRFISFPVRY